MPTLPVELDLVDLLVLGLVAIYALSGYGRGWLVAGGDLVGLICVLLVGLWLYEPVAQELVARTPLPLRLGRPAALLGLWAVSDFVFKLVIGGALAGPGAWIRRAPLGRLLGLAPGLARGLIVAVVLLTIAAAVPFPEPIAQQVRSSYVGAELKSRAGWLTDQIGTVFGEAGAETVGLLTVHPESNERVALPWRVENALIDPGAEARMLLLLNQERESRGLRPLQVDASIREVARQHSRDMFERSYFAHLSPEGATPFDRLQSGGVRFRAAGENLALAPNIEIAHSGLMNSPGHRENILNPAYARVGIGIADGGLRGKMVTENFAD